MDLLSAIRGVAAKRLELGGELGVAVRLAVAGFAGWAWGGSDVLLALVPFVFAAFWHARTRAEAFLVVWTYHVVAARGLIVGGARFFELSHLHAACLVCACASIVGLVWAACWKSARSPEGLGWHALRTSVLIAVTVLPPVGGLAVPHPLSAAGIWFPGWGLAGVAALIVVAASMRSVRWGVTPSVAVAMLAVLRAPPTLRLSAIDTVQTAYGASPHDLGDFSRQWSVATDAMRQINLRTAPVVVVPEGVGGLWSEPMRNLWATTAHNLRARGQTALVGVTFGSVIEPLAGGIVALGAGQGTYRQRVAVPLAMWRPGSSAFAPDWFASSTLDLPLEQPAFGGERGSVRAGLFVCWEIGSVWCVLRTVMDGAEVLVVVANTAWVAGTNAARAQEAMLAAWGALFGLPTALAMNA